MRGVVETGIPRCTTVMTGTGMVLADHEKFFTTVDHLATLGYRVLAVAEGEEPGIVDENKVAHLPDMIFLGLFGFIGPVKTDSRD